MERERWVCVLEGRMYFRIILIRGYELFMIGGCVGFRDWEEVDGLHEICFGVGILWEKEI